MRVKNKSIYLALTLITMTLISSINCQDYQQQDFQISDHEQSTFSSQSQGDPLQLQQQQFISQRRTACLVLSRYYTNSQNTLISSLIKQLSQSDQQSFINRLYPIAVELCQPRINQFQVREFFVENKEFNPEKMFYILEGLDFGEIVSTRDRMTPNQESILKFIKQFDTEMEIRKEQQQAKKAEEGSEDQGIQIFFISMKNLPSQLKYLYVVAVLIIAAAIVWYGFSQLDYKKQKKSNKRRKKQ